MSFECQLVCVVKCCILAVLIAWGDPWQGVGDEGSSPETTVICHWWPNPLSQRHAESEMHSILGLKQINKRNTAVFGLLLLSKQCMIDKIFFWVFMCFTGLQIEWGGSQISYLESSNGVWEHLQAVLIFLPTGSLASQLSDTGWDTHTELLQL